MIFQFLYFNSFLKFKIPFSKRKSQSLGRIRLLSCQRASTHPRLHRPACPNLRIVQPLKPHRQAEPKAFPSQSQTPRIFINITHLPSHFDLRITPQQLRIVQYLQYIQHLLQVLPTSTMSKRTAEKKRSRILNARKASKTDVKHTGNVNAKVLASKPKLPGNVDANVRRVKVFGNIQSGSTGRALGHL